MSTFGLIKTIQARYAIVLDANGKEMISKQRVWSLENVKRLSCRVMTFIILWIIVSVSGCIIDILRLISVCYWIGICVIGV